MSLHGECGANLGVGVVLPTFCEVSNVGRLIPEIKQLPLQTSILVVDDSSPDGTAEVVKQLQETYPDVFLLQRSKKSGLGNAITDGFRFFLGLDCAPHVVVTMDADYSHNPQDLPRLVAGMQGDCDLVIGSRYCSGGGTAGWPWLRKLISRNANALAQSLLGLQPADCTSGFRCYSTTFLKSTINCLHSQTYDIQIETINQAHQKGFNVKEIPILFINRKRGKSKLSLFEIENYLSYILKTTTLKNNP
ncbi:MAG: polyprenol monophosphomannose synthase [Candidatus Bathyarchaeota archaeon]|nr:polyprenol monophosphomannose synthase [Candidatus Bathyarchaeota archaeon]